MVRHREIHLGADVAWACAYHHRAAGDERLLAEAAPMILSIARFYTSRATKSERGWEIRHVISPDELHEDVSNSAYQNMMAKETIRLALRLAGRGLVRLADSTTLACWRSQTGWSSLARRTG